MCTPDVLELPLPSRKLADLAEVGHKLGAVNRPVPIVIKQPSDCRGLCAAETQVEALVDLHPQILVLHRRVLRFIKQDGVREISIEDRGENEPQHGAW